MMEPALTTSDSKVMNPKNPEITIKLAIMMEIVLLLILALLWHWKGIVLYLSFAFIASWDNQKYFLAK